MSRERLVLAYALAIGVGGWAAVWLSGPDAAWQVLALFILMAVLVESAGFRVPPSDPHSLVGVVVVTAAMALGPANGALIGAVSALIYGVLLPIIYKRPRTTVVLLGRPMLRSGARAFALLAGGWLATLLAGGQPNQPTLLFSLILCFPLVIQLNRVAREFIQGGTSGLLTWWRSSWSAIIFTDVLPLPFAALGAAIFTRLGPIYTVLAGVALLAVSIAVRTATLNLRSQYRSVRELGLLNQASRAIIRAELDVNALCDLIYREASKVVDTGSFHLGLFEPESDRYTLVVRVQDRVRLPPLTVDLPSGDGIVGWMRQTGRALLVQDFASEMNSLPARPRYQSDRPPRSGIYVPLLDSASVIGSISIQSYLPGAFDADDMRLLSLIADQAAVAISKARVFSDARQRAVQLQAIQEVGERITAILDLDELLSSVVRLISERFGYRTVQIYMIDEQERLILGASTITGSALSDARRRRAAQIGEGVVGVVARDVQPLLVNDVRAEPRYIDDDPGTRAELAVPIRFGERRIGVLDVRSEEQGRFAQSDLFVMQTLADQVAVAVESAQAFRAQREEAWTLNALLQVAENLAGANTMEEVLPAVVRLPPLLLGCDRCYCLIWSREQGAFTPYGVYGISAEQRAAFVGKPIPETAAPMLAAAARALAPVVLEDAAARRSACPPILDVFGGASLVALPLRARGTVLGVLVVDYNVQRLITQRELALAVGMANQMAGAIESAYLAVEAGQAAKLEEELQLARGIQTTLLPHSVPDLPGWSIAADWRSARIVGGDWYDYWRLGDEELGFVIADVSDKGVPAAMFMALSRSLVRAAALDGSAPAAALVRANRWITRDSDSGMFVTLFYGLVAPKTGHLRYSCAGHNPPLLVRAGGDVLYLRTPGIALGVLEEIMLGETEVTIEHGDVLVCYTDGVTEATDSAMQEFGVPRLVAVISQHRQLDSNAILDAIIGAVGRFTQGVLFDDATLVVIKRESEVNA